MNNKTHHAQYTLTYIDNLCVFFFFLFLFLLCTRIYFALIFFSQLCQLNLAVFFIFCRVCVFVSVRFQQWEIDFLILFYPIMYCNVASFFFLYRKTFSRFFFFFSSCQYLLYSVNGKESERAGIFLLSLLTNKTRRAN